MFRDGPAWMAVVTFGYALGMAVATPACSESSSVDDGAGARAGGGQAGADASNAGTAQGGQGAAGAGGSGKADDSPGGGAGGALGGAAAGGASGGSGAAGAGGASADGGSGPEAGAGGSGETGSAGGSSGEENGGAGGTSPDDVGGAGPGMGGAGAEGGADATGGAGGSLEPVCERADVVLCEDFESTEDGQIPESFQKTGSVSVTSEQAHGGMRSLRIEPESNGPRRITVQAADFSGLAPEHWGRIYYKVLVPHPIPASGVIHSTLVAGSAQSPLGDAIEVRPVDTVLDAQGAHQYLYNVQPESRAEFGTGSSYDYHYQDAWTCAEWHLDAANQRYEFFADGTEVEQIALDNGPGNYDGTEIPDAFQSLSFGWYNYQDAGEGFTVWLDDIVLSNARVGCEP